MVILEHLNGTDDILFRAGKTMFCQRSTVMTLLSHASKTSWEACIRVFKMSGSYARLVLELLLVNILSKDIILSYDHTH